MLQFRAEEGHKWELSTSMVQHLIHHLSIAKAREPCNPLQDRLSGYNLQLIFSETWHLWSLDFSDLRDLKLKKLQTSSVDIWQPRVLPCTVAPNTHPKSLKMKILLTCTSAKWLSFLNYHPESSRKEHVDPIIFCMI